MSRLLDMSEQFREQQTVKNKYDRDDNYEIGHKNALSDGDVFGKGENNGQVGSSDDIKMRNTLLVKNIFNKNKEYNAGTV